MKNVDSYTLADVAVTACPFEYYAAMRKQDPVHFDERAGAYIVSRHEDVAKAMAQPLVFSTKLGMRTKRRQEFQDEIEAYYRDAGLPQLDSLFTTDPPDHTRVRALMDKAFTAHRVAAMETGITEIANELIDSFIDDGSVEFVDQLAIPLPIFVIADQLGVPRSDMRAFKRWSTAVVEPLGRQLSRDRAMWCAEQMVEMWNYLAERIAERRESPQDNMISDLIQARIEDSEGPTFSDIEIIKIVRTFLVAGNETTTTAIGSGLLTLIQDPSLAGSIFGTEGTDRALLRLADEIVRLQSPVQAVPRVTTVDTDLGGKHIPKGALVLLGIGSANRDEAKFDRAECFNLERQNVGQHLGFGNGIHRCIGAMLARMEIKVAMKLVFARMYDIKLAIPADELAYEPSVIVRSLVRLPATFTRRAS